MNKIGRKIGLALGGLVASLALVSVPASAASGNPQQPLDSHSKLAAAAAPNECLHFAQMNPDEQKYRNTNNVPFTYLNTTYGANWFNVACGDLSFSVPRGQEALVDLTAVAELDCQGPAAGNSWCGGRFVLSGPGGPAARPDNNGRSDSFAWDSANGGAFDWQANTLDQVSRVMCPRDPEVTTPCMYNVQLQSRLENGATSVWIDDLKVTVDVSEGKVMVTSGATTP